MEEKRESDSDDGYHRVAYGDVTGMRRNSASRWHDVSAVYSLPVP